MYVNHAVIYSFLEKMLEEHGNILVEVSYEGKQEIVEASLTVNLPHSRRGIVIPLDEDEPHEITDMHFPILESKDSFFMINDGDIHYKFRLLNVVPLDEKKIGKIQREHDDRIKFHARTGWMKFP